MNPLPQFTKFADPPVPGLFNAVKGAHGESGQGDFYSRAFDDNKRYVTFTFGVAQFNSLTSFYKGFYNQQLSIAARTGRAPGFFFKAGQAAGFVVGLMAPWLVAYSIGSAFIKWATFTKSSKYYHFKPSMATYWSAVSMVANDIAVKSGFVTRNTLNGFFDDPIRTSGDERDILTPQQIKEINRGVEDLMDGYIEDTGVSNGINVYALATSYHRRQRAAFLALEDYYRTNTSPTEFALGADGENNTVLNIVRTAVNNSALNKPKRSFAKYLEDWTSGNAPGALRKPGDNGPLGDSSVSWLQLPTDSPGAAPGQTTASEAGLTEKEVMDPRLDLISEVSISEAKKGDRRIDGWGSFLRAELDDGAQYISFRVEPTGDASESFSSQKGEPQIAQTINSTSASARSTRFSLADGNVGDGVVASTIQGIIGAAKDMAMGAAQSLGIDGLAALGGNAFADIPDYWTGSTADMPKMQYRIKLFSPYGNRYSKFTNIWLPFSMLLAGALPLSTGSHSYTSPFLCQCFDRGRAQTRLGMITQMSVRRGITNLAFNRIGEPMMVEVDITVSEMSNIVHMPIKQGFRPITDALETIFEQETLFNDYIATLSSMSLAEQIYISERFKIGLTRYWKNLDSYWSIGHATRAIGDLMPMRVASMFAHGFANR